jgi:hypothetical protein
MFNFILGIIIGAAFAPFWIKLWNFAVEKIKTKLLKK